MPGSGSEGHWTPLPSHPGPLGNTRSEAKGWAGMFRVEDKVMSNLKAHSEFAAELGQREKLVLT